MDATEFRFPVVDNISTVSQREIDDVHAVDFAHLIVTLPPVDVLGHKLGCTEQHTLEIGVFIVVLHFYQDQFAFTVFGQDIHSVILVEFICLIAFAFQQLTDNDAFAQQGRKQAFQHAKIYLVAKQTFHRPIKTDVIAHSVLFLL